MQPQVIEATGRELQACWLLIRIQDGNERFLFELFFKC